MKKFVVLYFLLIFSLFTFASSGEFGGRVGWSFQFGTHIQRLGLMYQLFYFNRFVQVSHGSSFHYNWRSLGPGRRGLEMQTLVGLQFYWGEESGKKKYLLNEYSLMAAERVDSWINSEPGQWALPSRWTACSWFFRRPIGQAGPSMVPRFTIAFIRGNTVTTILFPAWYKSFYVLLMPAFDYLESF